MHTIVQLRPEYEGHAKHVIMNVHVLINDYAYLVVLQMRTEDLHHDFQDVWWAVMTRGRIEKDIMIMEGVPGFFRDPAGVYTGRLGIDATKPFVMRGNFDRKRVPGLFDVNLKDYFS